MSDLILLHHDQLVTTSLAIADGTDVQHKNIVGMIRKHAENLQMFGRVAFETRPFETSGGVQSQDVAFLNESQVTLLLTFMRNSEIVVKFKVALVTAFFDMRDRLTEIEEQKAPTLPTSVSHRADHIVSATRTFGALLKTAKTLGMGRTEAIYSANEATNRHTGVDLVGELDAESFLVEKAAAKPIVTIDPWQAAIEAWVMDNDIVETQTADVWQRALDRSGEPDKRSQMRIGKVMTQLQFKKNRRRIDVNGMARQVYLYQRAEVMA